MKAFITVMGHDTVGVVAKVSGLCSELNINIEDVTQSILQGMFAMIMLVDLSQYLTEDERAQYVQDYLDEGDFDGDGSMKIFPVAKSTEVMLFNDTDWQPFAEATGASYDDLATVEGLVDTAEKYYNWTDAQTAAPDDG